jgi:hypothetical protein
MSGVAAGGGPIDRGVDSVSRWPRLNISRWPRLKVSRWPRLKHVVAVMMMVTMYRFLSDGVARKADRQSDRSDKAFDHGPMFSIEIRRSIAASSTGENAERESQTAGRTKERYGETVCGFRAPIDFVNETLSQTRLHTRFAALNESVRAIVR